MQYNSLFFSFVVQLLSQGWFFMNPMDCNIPDFPILHYLLEFVWLIEFDSFSLSQWCHPTISSSVALFSSCPQSFPASGTFPMSHLFASDDQNTGASASVLQVNIQGWSPLKLTGLISFLFNGLSCVFSGTTIQRHQFFGILPLLRSSCQTVCDHWEDQSLDYTDFVSRVM